MSEPRDFIQAYLDGELEDDRFDAFQDWLREDPANLQAWATAMFLHHELHDCAAQLESSEAAEVSSASSFRNSAAAAKQGLMGADLLVTLQQIEDAAESATVVAITEDKKAKHTSLIDLSEISTSDMVAVGGYVLKRALMSKPGIGAIAALLAIAATLSLLFIFQGEADPTSQGTPPIAQQQPAHERSTRAVATLTADQDAQWAERALARGSALHAGQRLTLTQGFAEITTNDGAIAILESPCTIEMIDSSNALRLVSGKLVGICETDSSKGFLVRTAALDVTDLGTRFGVDATRHGSTEVHVYLGQVEVTRLVTDGSERVERMRVVEGQAVRSDLASASLSKIEPDFHRFASGLGHPGLPSTGVGLVVDEIDPNWRIVAVDQVSLDAPIALQVSGNGGHTVIHENNPLIGQWLIYSAPPRDPKTVDSNERIIYTVQVELVIPHGVDLDKTSLEAVCFFDNEPRAIRINNRSVFEPLTPQRREISRRLSGGLSELSFQHGTNMVQFDIANSALTPMGLYVQWELVDAAPQADQEVKGQP